MGDMNGLLNNLKLASAIIAGIGGVFIALKKAKESLSHLTNFKPLLRKNILEDFKLLKEMKKTDPEYEVLKQYIAKEIDLFVREKEKKVFISKLSLRYIIGLVMVAGFGVLTYFVYKDRSISNWSAILTIWLAGVGMNIFMAAKESLKKQKANEKKDDAQ